MCQRIVRACNYKTPGQDNWLITQYITKEISHEKDVSVKVDIDWRLSSCSGACKRTLEVHRFLSDSEELPDVNKATDTLIGEVSSKQSSGEGSTALSFTLAAEKNGFYLGVRSTGSCYMIYRIAAYCLRCPAKNDSLVLYPEVAAPASGEIQVDAACVDGATAVGSLRLSCNSDGEWTGSPACTCDCGYIEDSSSCKGIAIIVICCSKLNCTYNIPLLCVL